MPLPLRSNKDISTYAQLLKRVSETLIPSFGLLLFFFFSHPARAQSGEFPEVQTYEQLVSAVRDSRRSTHPENKREKVREAWTLGKLIELHTSEQTLRHTVGFELMRKTKNIRQVQEFLGHSFVTTTQIYTHVTKEELRECAELLSI